MNISSFYDFYNKNNIFSIKIGQKNDALVNEIWPIYQIHFTSFL